MYFSHFGLSEAPFGITPNPSFFYSGCSRGDILQALLYAIEHGEGIIKVTGEVGSGKTMLCRMLENHLPPQVEVIYLVNPSLSREQVVFALASELHLPIEGKRADEVIRILQQDLIGKHIEGKQVLLLVEEAQAMSLETLEEIRLFSNLETARHKLLQIILFGQPELDENLALPRMRQLKERITHSFKVPPLAPDQIGDFLLFRMRQAGYRGPNVFSASAIAQLARVSQGIVRRINILADKAMLAAFADNTHSVDSKQMQAAIRDSEFANKRKTSWGNWGWKLTISAAVLALFGTGLAAGLYLRQTPIVVAQALPAAPQAPSAKPAASAASTAQALTSSATAAASLPPALSSSAINSSNPSNATSPASELKTANAIELQSEIEREVASDKATAMPRSGAALHTPLQSRLLASQAWLRDTEPDYHTLQLNLVIANNQTDLLRFVQKLEADVGTEAIFVYPSRIGGVARYGVLLGSFATRQQAKEQMLAIQKQFAYPSQIRTVRGLRNEIHKSHSEDLWAVH
mgnify:CR=1 FL=1